ncbi:28S ribosomal protein S31, mitochondrial [Aplysia californica]|uniref:Small ribosomal subunit protein mS31 n=1 Tax=Aplysia californica TaxID=6500 RepID=A0ABM0JVW4_APLCA|nr:28S ribosomal protein S31, mitochondrial [Aplysia californica]
MIRSQLVRLVRTVHSKGNFTADLGSIGRPCGKLASCPVQVTCQRNFRATAVRGDESQDSNDAPGRPLARPRIKNKKRAGVKVSQELEQAAVKAAKSLPGDWTKTADELLARLSSHQEPKVMSQEEQAGEVPPARDVSEPSLLETMQVGRGFKPQRGRGDGGDQRSGGLGLQDDDMYNRSATQFSGSRTQMGGRRVARRTEVFKDIFSVPRIEIFDAEKVKSKEGDSATVLGQGLSERVEQEKLHHMQGGLPRNAFEEMIEWTREGKMWTFPVDNEADMWEERQYKFHQHVFLDGDLEQFPARGPVRKFMELVVLGLSQNPWMSVPEKRGHIAWFAEYFREKQDLLESSLGLEGRMKEKEGVKEGE